MMSVLEYAEDMNKDVEEILKMCNVLGIKVSGSDDILSDDDIVELDNEFQKQESENTSTEDATLDEEILKKIEEDDYYDEVVDSLIDKKDANKSLISSNIDIYSSEYIEIQMQVDRLNNIFDNELKHIKDLFLNMYGNLGYLIINFKIKLQWEFILLHMEKMIL